LFKAGHVSCLLDRPATAPYDGSPWASPPETGSR
jgi:hypothetical protein